MRSPEHAEILLRKAAADEFVLHKLIPDPASPDEVIGFHAQQAVEKMIKAVLASRAIEYRRNHDLVGLMDLLRDQGIAFPEAVEESRRLGPFATTFRYEDLLFDTDPPFDRAWALECVRAVRVWAEDTIRAKSR